MVEIVDNVVLVRSYAEVVLSDLDIPASVDERFDLILSHFVFEPEAFAFFAEPFRLDLRDLAGCAHRSREAEGAQHVLSHNLLAHGNKDDGAGHRFLRVLDLGHEFELRVFRRNGFLESGL